MSKGRIEAFSDGVIAILITIMVLEFKNSARSRPGRAAAVTAVFLSYMLSFVFLGVYWNNHHHLLQAIKHVDGRALWANLHLLFWLSLIPFVTAWMGENNFATWPVAFYGIVQLFAGAAFYILVHSLITLHGKDSALATAIGSDVKGKASVLIYAVAIPLAFFSAWLACAIYVLVVVMWLIPDRRIEKTLAR